MPFDTSPKFPRTYHVPFSPGKGSNDKVHENCDKFLNTEIVIMEKLDGGNTGIDHTGVYARSRNGIATHPSFNPVKAWAASNKHLFEDNWVFFYFENMYGIHSIEYKELPHFMFVIGTLMNMGTCEPWFVPWNDVKFNSDIIKVPHCPELFVGKINSEKELKSLIEDLMKSESTFGGPKEGVVIRQSGTIPFSSYGELTGKYVRENHVETNIHWSKDWKPANIKNLEDLYK